MAKVNYDGVVEAVRFNQDGQIEWVRAYLRRGPIFSDRVLVDRSVLVEHIKAGKRYFAGRRIPQLGGTFEVSSPLRVINGNDREFIISGDGDAQHDHLPDVPRV